jgi:MFS family permease
MSSAPGSAAGAVRPGGKIPLFTMEAWAPLKVPLFRSLWIATSIAQIGTWTREAAGPTLMEHLTSTWPDKPAMVSKVLFMSNLPICLFSVFAGALADVLDRRRLLIVTQLWMIVVSVILGIFTYTGHITPRGLLFMTFLLGMGTAAFGPALQAVLPELVPKEHFSLAINMNSIALNVARALGPALFIVVVSFIPGDRGAGASFLLTGVSFVAAAWVLFTWKRPPRRAAVHGEEVWSAIRAGFKYTIHSPANRAILLRVFTFIVPALVIWSQVPIIATSQLGRRFSVQEIQMVSAALYTFVGLGAIFGVLLMPGLHARYKIDPVVNVCTALFAIGLTLLSFTHSLWMAALILVFLGVNWVIIPTNFNTATQKSVPVWVKGRAISFYLTVLFGSFAIGAQLWGWVATRWGIHAALLAAGISMLALLVLAIWFPLTLNEGKDLALARSGPPTDEVLGRKPDGSGPVQLAIRYSIPEHRVSGFTDLLHDLRRTRLRNGASVWRLERTDKGPAQCELTERVIFGSWQEYTRYHSRTTKWDQMLEALAREYHVGTSEPETVTGELRRGFAVKPVKPASVATAPGRAGSGPTTMERPVQQPVAWALDRIIDEMFLAYDRITKPGVKRTTWE